MNSVLMRGNVCDKQINLGLYKEGTVQVVNFSIANNELRGKKISTSFFRCQAWGTVAKSIAEKLAKGDDIIITEAKLVNKNWVDKRGIKRNCVSIEVFKFEMGFSKGSGTGIAKIVNHGKKGKIQISEEEELAQIDKEIEEELAKQKQSKEAEKAEEVDLLEKTDDYVYEV